MRHLTSALLLVIGILPVAHADEEQPITPAEVKLGRPVDFAQDIAPIFRANCVACHNKTKTEGQLILEDTTAIMKGGSSGAVIVPGKPDESYLYQVVARTEESYMPPMPNEVQAKKLTPQELGLLRQWIIEGAKAGDSASASNMTWQAINTGLNAIYAVDTDPFGRFVAAGRAGNVIVYDLLAKENPIAVHDAALAKDSSPQQQAHRDYVHAIAFHPDGQMFATAGFQVVKLWSRDTANVIYPVALPKTTSKMVASADGTLAAVQQADGVIRVIDLATDKVINELPGHATDAATVLGIHGPENQYVAVANTDATVKLLNRADNAVVAASETLGAKSVAAAFIVAGNKLVVLLEDGTLRPLTLDAAAKTLAAADPLKSDKGAIKQIQLAEPLLMCRVEGNAVELRKTDSLQPAITIQAGTPNTLAAISANAERVATLGPDGVAELWNTKDGKRIATLNTDIAAIRTLATRATDKAVRDARVTVVKAQITEDEKRVTEQKESLKKADEEIKKTTEALADPKKKLEEAVAKTAAAKTALDAKPEDAALKKAFEAAEKAETTAKETLTNAENAAASAKKGKTLSEQAIKRAEEKVAERKQLLATAEAEAKAAADAHTAADAEAKKTITSQQIAFVGNELVATIDAQPGNAPQSYAVRLFNSADGIAADVLSTTLPDTATPLIAESAPGAILIQQADGQLAKIAAFPKWKLAKTLGPQSDGKPSVFVDRVLALAFSPDGKILAAGGGEASRSGELTLWNVADGKLIRSIEDAHSDTVYGLDFSRDGKLLASAAADKFVKVFDVATGQHVRSYEGHTHHVMDVSWKGDGTQLASAGADNAIKVWNAETGEQSRTISTYSKQVTSLEFIGMEDDFISSSGDKRVFRHKAANGGTVREFKGCPDYVYCSATTSDGMIVAAGCEDGILRIWNGKDGKEIAAFKP